MTAPRTSMLVCPMAAALLVVLTGAAGAAEPVHPPEWDPEVVELFSTLPIQEGGRVKPLRTHADFLLLRLNGIRGFRLETAGDEDGALRRMGARMRGGEKRTPMEWLLDCLFHPELSEQYEVFLIEDARLLDAIGVDHSGKKRRDRYSYAQLRPGRERLFHLAQEYMRIESRDLTPDQRQVLNLEQNLRDFEILANFLNFTREEFDLAGSKGLEQMFGGRDRVRLSDILERALVLRGVLIALSTGEDLFGGEIALDEAARATELDVLIDFLRQLNQVGATAIGLALFPPAGSPEEAREWHTPASLISLAFEESRIPSAQLSRLRALEDAALAYEEGPEPFKAAVEQLHAQLVAAADERDEYAKIPLEVTLYDGQFFHRALALYLLSFILTAISWMVRRDGKAGRSLSFGIYSGLGLATALLVAGITLRCIIRERPPVTTLYETILFITAVAVIVALVTEVINRQRVALATAAVLGAMGMFLANKYEAKEGVDTMPSLIAVLDTNFWLSTHVTTVTTGYAAGLLAAALAHVYILGQIIGFRENDKPFYRSVARMVYGSICFGLVFATVGTILGGIWANYSWGRFWGWDPKENGALMIVLWQLFILHARLGGYIRDYGVCMSAIVGGIVVAFSWFGVNLLGVGLHSYGFTSGVARALMTFYIVQGAVLAMGGAYWVYRRASGPQEAVVPPHADQTPQPKKRGKGKAKPVRPADQPG